MSQPMPTVLFVAIVTLVFCDGAGAQAGHEVMIVDGVRVVQNSARAWRPGEEWRLGREPVYVVGVVDGAPEYLLDRVVGATVLSTGTLAMLDLGSSRVRLFDSRGRFIGGFGSKGEGPGEFRQPLGLFAISGDSLAVVDRLERLHFFDREGRLARTVSMGATPADVDPISFNWVSQYPRMVGFLGDGSYVSRTAGDLQLSEGFRLVEAQTPEVSFTLHSGAGLLERTLARVRGPTFAPHPSNIILPMVFDSDVHAAVWRDELVLGVASEAEIRWVDRSGNTRQTARRPWSR
ncbi:MAG: hypothetical protein RLN75_07160, partial [Longimicrobiales bacterium]